MSPVGGSTLMTSAPKSAITVVDTGPAMKLAASMTLMPARRSATQHPAPGEVRHEGAGAEGPRLGVLAVHDLVDERADLRGRDRHHVADLVREAAPGRAAVVERREHGADVEDDAVRILVRTAVKLRREVGEIAPDLTHVRRVLDAEAVEALHGGLEADPPRGVEREALVEHPDQRSDGGGGVVVLRPPEQQRAAALDVAQVDVVAESDTHDGARAIDDEHQLRLGVVPYRLGMNAHARAEPHRGHRRALGE